MFTAYNLIPESRSYYLYRKALPLREPQEICAHNKTKAAQINERWGKIPFLNNSSILPPKLPPKGFETVQHGAALLCTHGTKSIPSLGTQHHQTQQNRTVTHKF
mgnify:CR=1 FL=1